MIWNVIAVLSVDATVLWGLSEEQLLSGDGFTWEPVAIETPARLSINNKVVDKNKVVELQMVYRTCQHLPSAGRYVYKARMASGAEVVIGGTGRPYPVTVSSRTLPDNLTDSQLEEVTVTYSRRGDWPLID